MLKFEFIIRFGSKPKLSDNRPKLAILKANSRNIRIKSDLIGSIRICSNLFYLLIIENKSRHKNLSNYLLVFKRKNKSKEENVRINHNHM